MRWTMVGVLVAALALGACTPAPDDDGPEVTPTFKRTVPPWEFVEMVPSVAPDGTRWECDADMSSCGEVVEGQLPPTVPFPQDPAMTERLSDRRLTREEYESQFLDYVACLEEFDIGVHVASMSTPMISFSTDAVPMDIESDAYRASTFCGDTHWEPVNYHWQAYEMPQPHLEEDVEHLLACMTEAGMTPVITTVPDDGPEQAFARRDLSEQIREEMFAGEVPMSVWETCIEGMPSAVAENEKEGDS
ncbi:hypothetical protein [Sanguibacter sp. HDW7]|uniref:hypothetical protein n=1 Tax=Sanguibacter sp. HDW7 TaxID=2714931 RepID=UPI00140B81FB|nr:hypothetical protein [Sanguibacter sp. HDW7]QIK84518.1 hypothetical protein G7063_13530 [Sanguibacter sp. HDW7]